MAPPEAEWMLWAKRLRDENKILLQRIDSKPDSSALETFIEEMRSLASTIQHLQQENHTLRQKMHELERNVSQREQDMCDQVQGLGRSIADMNKELNLVVDVMKGIREGGGSGLACYQRGGRRQSSRPVPPPSRQRGRTKITYRARTASSRAPSQLTTTDESIHPEEPKHLERRVAPNHQQHTSSSRPWARPQPHAKPHPTTEQNQHQQQKPPHPQSPPARTTTTSSRHHHHQETRARERYAALESIGVDPQGEKSLEEYFRDGAGSVVRAMQLYEKRAAKAFVCGLRDKGRRMELWERLTEGGWSWQLLRKEMQWMLECEGVGKGKGKGKGGREKEKGGRKVSMEL